MNDTLRVFVAVEMPLPVVEHLRETIVRIRPQTHRNLRTVNPTGVHLTLKFLGDTEKNQIAAIIDAMVLACVNTQPFKLHLTGTGVFPNTENPKVLWAGVDGQLENLRELQQSVEMALSQSGIPRDRRNFNPHLTLARIGKKITSEQWQTVVRTLISNPVNETLGINVNSISLMQSRLSSDGAVYERIAYAPFGS